MTCNLNAVLGTSLNGLIKCPAPVSLAVAELVRGLQEERAARLSQRNHSILPPLFVC